MCAFQIYNIKIKHLHVCNITLYRTIEQKKLQYIKMSKHKSDDGLEILEKPVKKNQILLNFYFGCSSTSNKVKKDSKTKKTTSSSATRSAKYKTIEENWIEKSLVLLDARIW